MVFFDNKRLVEKNFVLYNGVEIPALALGTWQIDDKSVEKVVFNAINEEYRHIDTAIAYQNESGVGRGIKLTGIKREDIFITSKIPAEVKTYELAKKSIEESLKRLDTDYIDLMLIHAPKPWSEMHGETTKRYYRENIEVYKALEEAYKEGKLKAIGLSNFQINDIKNILRHSKIKPMVNQIKVYIGNTPHELIRFCQMKNILVEAYSPNATGRLKNNELVCDYAKSFNSSVMQLGIRYCYELGTLPIPKATSLEHLRENTEVDFKISEDVMEDLKKIEQIV